MRSRYSVLWLPVAALLCYAIWQLFLPDAFIVDAPTGEGLAAYNQLRFGDPITGQVPTNLRQLEWDYVERTFLRADVRRRSSLELETRYRGPNNIGGRTRALAVDSRNADILLAGGVNGGLWRSENGGDSWSRVTEINVPTQSFTALVQDTRPDSADTWYAGTGESELPLYQGRGIYRSRDNGQTWSVMENTLSNSTVAEAFQYTQRLAMDTSGRLFAATHRGVFLLEPDATQWMQVLAVPQLPGIGNTYIFIDSKDRKYAAVAGLGFFTSQNGQDWENLAFPIDVPNTLLNINASAATPDTLYFSYRLFGDPLNPLAIWQFNGERWEERTENIQGSTVAFGVFAWSNTLRIHPAQPNTVFLGNSSFIRSRDAFATASDLRPLSSYLPLGDLDRPLAEPPGDRLHPDHHELIFFTEDNRKAIVANDGGVYRTDDILSDTLLWSAKNNGYAVTDFYAVAIDEWSTTFNPDLVMGGTQDNGSLLTLNSDPEASWTPVGGGDGGYCFALPERNLLYTSLQFGRTSRVDIVDSTAVNITPEVVDPFQVNVLFINPFELDPNNDNRLYYPADGFIYRNDDAANATSFNWNRIENSEIPPNSGVLSALAASRQTEDWLFYGTTGGKLFKLFRPYEDATTAVDISLPGFGRPFINCIATNPEDAEELMVVVSSINTQSFFWSSDQGMNWTPVGGNLEEFSDGSGSGPRGLWAHIIPNYRAAGSKLYLLGTSMGLYATEVLNGMDTQWEMVAPDVIGTVQVSMIRSRPEAGFIAIATQANGIYEIKYPTEFTTNTADLGSTIPLKVYPNPSTERVFIEGIWDDLSNVQLQVLSANGSVIWQRPVYEKTLIELNISRLPAGSYVIRLLTNGRLLASDQFNAF